MALSPYFQRMPREEGWTACFCRFFCCVVQISDSFLWYIGRSAQSRCPVDSAKLVGSCVGIADHQGSVSGILARP